jgi:NAD+ kinase
MLLASLLSPDIDVFTTPPSTPTLLPPDVQIRPSLSRKNSRPSSLHLYPSTDAEIVVDDQPSPEATSALHEIPEKGACMTNGTQMQSSRPPRMHSAKSPCFVHSHLDKGASLSDWLRSKPRQEHHRPSLNSNLLKSRPQDLHLDYDEDEEYYGSLTAQLAETAVGVREMSKQLGMRYARLDRMMILISFSRSCSRPLEHPACSDRHQSSR